MTPSRNDAILDLIFTDIKEFYNDPVVLSPFGTSDHACIDWKIKRSSLTTNKSRRKVKVKVRPIKSSQLNSFHQWLSNYNWEDVFAAQDIDGKVFEFSNVLGKAIDKFFPTKVIKFCDDKPFINGRIKSLTVKRDKAYAKRHRNTYKFYRNKVALEINIAKKQYYETKVKPVNSSNP